jgi:subtilisin-like proprotein convertase family protein/Ca2+-binding EF-hand superfamily protein
VLSGSGCRLGSATGTAAVFAAVLFLLTATQQANAQAGLREALEKLDRNENGLIEPEEVTPLARPYLERVLKQRRMGLERPVAIDRIQESARIYHAIQNGVSGQDIRPEPENKIKGFGPTRKDKIPAGFGIGRIRYPYTRADLEEAEETLQRSDRNGDNMLSRTEALRARWTHRNPFDDDLNKDDQLSKMELTQRYARRRLLEEDSGELVQRARRVGNGIKPSRKSKRDESQWWKSGGSTFWLTASLMGRFDANKNGRLEIAETRAFGLPAEQIDTDGDGEIVRDELFALVKLMQEQAGDAIPGLPGWFYEMDENKDGQVALAEFMAQSRNITEFRTLDLNDDGLLTAKEASSNEAVVGGRYRNERAEVLPPRRTIISEIEVEDDYLIGDINVQISITHSNVGFLDAFITSPDGQRIELFTEVGGGGDHFEDTIFDDESKTPITKGRAPFKGNYRTKGPEHKQPGLWAFDNKSVKGVWQLVVRGTRNDRFGMLHNWSIIVTPKDDVPERTKEEPAEATSEKPSKDVKPPTTQSKAKPKSKEPSLMDKFQDFARSQKKNAK